MGKRISIRRRARHIRTIETMGFSRIERVIILITVCLYLGKYIGETTILIYKISKNVWEEFKKK